MATNADFYPSTQINWLNKKTSFVAFLYYTEYAV